MSITEAQRYQVYESMKASHGDDVALSLMAMLPPVGWADVATKHQLSALESHLTAELASTRREIELRFDSLRADVDRLDRTQHSFVTWLIASQATLFTAICAATALILRAG